MPDESGLGGLIGSIGSGTNPLFEVLAGADGFDEVLSQAGIRVTVAGPVKQDAGTAGVLSSTWPPHRLRAVGRDRTDPRHPHRCAAPDRADRAGRPWGRGPHRLRPRPPPDQPRGGPRVRVAVGHARLHLRRADVHAAGRRRDGRLRRRRPTCRSPPRRTSSVGSHLTGRTARTTAPAAALPEVPLGGRDRRAGGPRAPRPTLPRRAPRALLHGRARRRRHRQLSPGGTTMTTADARPTGPRPACPSRNGRPASPRAPTSSRRAGAPWSPTPTSCCGCRPSS